MTALQKGQNVGEELKQCEPTRDTANLCRLKAANKVDRFFIDAAGWFGRFQSEKSQKRAIAARREGVSATFC